MPDVQAKYRQWCEGQGDFADRTAKAFEVSVEDIRAQAYDLSINRYQIRRHVAQEHDDPKEILAKLKDLEATIQQEIDELLGMLE